MTPAFTTGRVTRVLWVATIVAVAAMGVEIARVYRVFGDNLRGVPFDAALFREAITVGGVACALAVALIVASVLDRKRHGARLRNAAPVSER